MLENKNLIKIAGVTFETDKQFAKSLMFALNRIY